MAGARAHGLHFGSIFSALQGAFTLNVNRRLATCASGRLRHLLKTGQPFKNNFVSVKLSNRLPSVRLVETSRKLLMTSNFDCFASLCIQCKLTYKQTFYTFQYSIISAAVEAFVLTRIINEIFHYSRCTTPKRVTCCWGLISASLR